MRYRSHFSSEVGVDSAKNCCLPLLVTPNVDFFFKNCSLLRLNCQIQLTSGISASTVLKLHPGFIFFTEIVGCPNFFHGLRPD